MPRFRDFMVIIGRDARWQADDLANFDDADFFAAMAAELCTSRHARRRLRPRHRYQQTKMIARPAETPEELGLAISRRRHGTSMLRLPSPKFRR